MDSSKSGDYPVARLIWTICPPIIALVGIVGNITTILVFTRKPRRSSTSLYLTWVAVADLMVLVVVYPRWWIIHVFSTDIRTWNNIVCKVHMFFGYTVGYVSTYILAAVTVERVISVTLPYKSKLICRISLAKCVICVLLILNVCLNGHVIYGFSLVDHMSANSSNSSNSSIYNNKSSTTEINIVRRTCDWTRYDNYADFYVNVHDAVFSIGQVAVLLSIFVLGGAIISWKMTMSQRLHHRMKNATGVLSKGPLAMNKKSRQITVTLILVDLMYFLCTMPVTIFLAMRHSIVVDSRMSELQEILFAVFNQLYFVNHAINFFLFTITGDRFRQDVKKLFSCETSQESNLAMVSDSINFKEFSLNSLVPDKFRKN